MSNSRVYLLFCYYIVFPSLPLSANVNAKCDDGHTARSLALKNGDIKTISFLDEVQMMYFARIDSSTSNECKLSFREVAS